MKVLIKTKQKLFKLLLISALSFTWCQALPSFEVLRTLYQKEGKMLKVFSAGQTPMQGKKKSDILPPETYFTGNLHIFNDTEFFLLTFFLSLKKNILDWQSCVTAAVVLPYAAPCNSSCTLHCVASPSPPHSLAPADPAPSVLAWTLHPLPLFLLVYTFILTPAPCTFSGCVFFVECP